MDPKEIFFEESLGNDKIIYKTAGFFGGKKAKEMFFDKAVQEDKLSMKSGPDGAISLTVLREVAEPNIKTNLKQGLRVFGTYQATKNGFECPHQTIIKPNSKVCFVNTGESNNSKIREVA